ncbi:MAG: O-antigen ligase family protein [Marinosulfonomonas sp.]
MALFASPPAEPMFVPQKPDWAVQILRHRSVWPKRIVTTALMAVVVLSPFPAGSNTAILWMVWASVIGITGVVYAQFCGSRFSRFEGSTVALMAVIAVFLIASLWQAAPLFGPRQSMAPSATILATVRAASYLGFFYLMLCVVDTPRRASLFAHVLLFGVTFHALLAMVSLKTLGDGGLTFSKTAYLGAATGGFVSRNSFATQLGMALVLGLALLVRPKRSGRRNSLPWLEKAALTLCLFVLLVTLISTESRMGIVASAVGLLIVLVCSRSVNMANLLMGGLAVGLVVMVFGPGLTERFLHIPGAATTRLELYRQVLEMIRTRPLFGFGNDSFPLAFQMFHAPPVSAGFVWDKAHSTYLTLWAEMGVIIGSLPIISGGIAANALWRKTRNQRQAPPLAVAALGALTLAALHSLFDFSLEIQANMFALLTLVALGLAHPNPERKSDDTGSTTWPKP